MKNWDSVDWTINGIIFGALCFFVWLVTVGVSAGQSYGALDYDRAQKEIARQAKEEALKEEALISRGKLQAFQEMGIVPSKGAQK